MVNLIKCKNCGKVGDLKTIKLYPVPGSSGKSAFLCENCYQKIIQKQKVKNLKYKTCPVCKHFIEKDTYKCYYCGKKFEEKKEEDLKCKTCGSKIKNGQKYCKICGRYIITVKNGQNITLGISEPKPQVSIPKKTVATIIAITAIIIISGLFFINLPSIKTIETKSAMDYGPNANLYLDNNNIEILDDKGCTAIKINFTTFSGAEVWILNNRNLILAKQQINKDEKNKIIRIGNYKETLPSGKYIIKGFSGENEICNLPKWFRGPSVEITNIETEWNFNQEAFEDELKQLKIHLHNNGDMPAYIYSVEVKLEIMGQFKTYNINNIYNIVKKMNNCTIPLQINQPCIVHRNSQTIYIKLKDKNENILAEIQKTIQIDI